MLPSKESERATREKFTVERLDEQSNFFGPVLPPHLLEKSSQMHDDKGQAYGPMLSDHLSKKKDELLENLSEKNKIFIGPILPEHFRSDHFASEKEVTLPSEKLEDNIGPAVDLMATGDVTSSHKFMNAQNFREKVSGDSSSKRETWMTELPEKRRANFGLLPRHFKSQVQVDKEGEVSLWTETPADKNRKQEARTDHKEILLLRRLQERDKQMEKLAKKVAKKLRKKESLLELHLKNIKKKKDKEKKKEKKASNFVPERRPFDRNIDLQVRKFDEKQTRTIIHKSQFLNNRFAPGQSKFL